MDAVELIAGPRRRAILELVRDGELPVGEIAGRMGLTYSATSQHLAKLLEAGALTVRREGKYRLYRTNRERLDELTRSLSAMWQADIARLAGVASEAAEAIDAAGASGAPT